MEIGGTYWNVLGLDLDTAWGERSERFAGRMLFKLIHMRATIILSTARADKIEMMIHNRSVHG